MSDTHSSIGRYDPCPCGSGKKYKFCCEAADLRAYREARSFAKLAMSAKPIEEELLADDEYLIVGEAIEELRPDLPPDANKEFHQLHELVNSAPERAIPRLEAFIEKYPSVPMAKNWLVASYRAAGQEAAAQELGERLWLEHPDYFFARVDRAQDLLAEGKFDEALDVLGGRDLKEIYPHRSVFHVTEALALWSTLVQWHGRRDEPDKALDYLAQMKEIAPDHPMTVRTEQIMAQIEMLSALEVVGQSLFRMRARRGRPPGTSVQRRGKTSRRTLPAPDSRNAC